MARVPAGVSSFSPSRPTCPCNCNLTPWRHWNVRRLPSELHNVLVVQVSARLYHVVPLCVNKLFVIPLYHCVKVTRFRDAFKRPGHLSCGTPVLPRAHVVIDHSERYLLTGLVNLSEVIPTT